MSDTKFPLPREGWSGDTDLLDPRLVDDWFKRCIEDRPNPDDYDAAAWDDFMLFEQRWYVKWFGQFKEKPPLAEYVIGHDAMPFGNRECAKCGGVWKAAMSVYCPHCMKKKSKMPEYISVEEF